MIANSKIRDIIDDIEDTITESGHYKQLRANLYNWYSKPSKNKIIEYERIVANSDNCYIYTASKYNFTVVDVITISAYFIRFRYITHKYIYYVEYDRYYNKATLIERTTR